MNLDILEFINKRIPRNVKTCFCSGIILGWITHFYMLTHKLPNWDDISQIDNVGMSYEVGRWLLKPLQHIAQRASNPAIHGMMLILLITLGACMVVSALELKSVTSSILVPAVMITFPSVTGILYFMFTAHYYALSIFLFCTSAYLIRKYKFGFLPAGICMVFGLAIYQPFVSVAITLFLIILIKKGIEGESFKSLLKNGVIYAATLGFSTIIYIIIARIIYPASGGEQYGGVDKMGHISLTDFPINVGRVYKRVLEYFIIKPFAFVKPSMHILNIIICISIFALAVFCIIKYKFFQRKLELIFVCLMAFLIPFAMGFVYFMAPEVSFSVLMLYAYSLLYVFMIALSEWAFYHADEIKDKKKNTICIISASACAGLILILVYTNYLLDAQAYFRTSIAMERVTNYYNRILSKVESMDGYKYGDCVAVLGEFYYKDNPAPVEIPLFKDDECYRELSGVSLENGIITMGTRSDFIRTYMGFDPGYLSINEKNSIMESEEYKAMPNYPAEGSIVKINDIWIVKLCE